MSDTSFEIKSIPFYQLLLLTVVVVYFSVMLHEAAHWAVLQILDCGPTMGFTGIIQKWDVPPLHPEEWQKIHYPGIGTGWLRLEQLPRTHTQWAIMLLSGQLIPVLLILVGIFLVFQSTSPFQKVVGFMLAFVNGAMALTKIIGWVNGNIGDLYFFSLYSGLNVNAINALFIFLLGAGLVWALRQLPCPVRRRWMQALVLGYFIIILPLQKANSMLLSAINTGKSWAMPVAGWSKPVWIVTLFFLLLALACFHLLNSRWSKKQ